MFETGQIMFTGIFAISLLKHLGKKKKPNLVHAHKIKIYGTLCVHFYQFCALLISLESSCWKEDKWGSNFSSFFNLIFFFFFFHLPSDISHFMIFYLMNNNDNNKKIIIIMSRKEKVPCWYDVMSTFRQKSCDL